MKGRQSTMLFPQERVRLKTTQSKLASTVLRLQRYLPLTEWDKNHPVKDSVNSTQGIRLFSEERV